jgi:hypothetical protein
LIVLDDELFFKGARVDAARSYNKAMSKYTVKYRHDTNRDLLPGRQLPPAKEIE